jgi:hypothetical protein
VTTASQPCTCTISRPGTRVEARILDRACPVHREPEPAAPAVEATVRLTFAMSFRDGRLTGVYTECDCCALAGDHRTTDLALGWTETHAYAHKLNGAQDVTR